LPRPQTTISLHTAKEELAFTKESTAISAMQSERQTCQSMSQTKADIAG
jgi:hypothetical protein